MTIITPDRFVAVAVALANRQRVQGPGLII